MKIEVDIETTDLVNILDYLIGKYIKITEGKTIVFEGIVTKDNIDSLKYEN